MRTTFQSNEYHWININEKHVGWICMCHIISKTKYLSLSNEMLFHEDEIIKLLKEQKPRWGACNTKWWFYVFDLTWFDLICLHERTCVCILHLTMIRSALGLTSQHVLAHRMDHSHEHQHVTTCPKSQKLILNRNAAKNLTYIFTEHVWMQWLNSHDEIGWFEDDQ